MFPKELQDKINILFKNNEEKRKKLLAGDVEAIRELTSSQRGIDSQEIVYAFENDETDALKYLYNKAKRNVEIQNLYKELCHAYYLINQTEETETINKGRKNKKC